MATVAMFLALSGSAVAAGKKLVSGGDVQNGSLTGQDLKDKSVPGDKIKPGTLSGLALGNKTLGGDKLKDKTIDGGKIKPGSLTLDLFGAGQLPKGDKGDKGTKGDKGDKGEKGDPGTTVDLSQFVRRPRTGISATTIAPTGGTSCEAFGSNVSATVDVGPSGLVAIYAEAEISDQTQEQAKVQVFEPTSLSSCPQVLLGGSVNPGFELKRTTAASNGGTTGLGSPLIAHVAPGQRTFSLRFGADSPGSYQIRNPSLWVLPL
jgi:hypothetical protein